MAFEDLYRPLSNVGFRGAIRWIIILSGAMLFAQQFAGDWMVTYLGLIPNQVTRHYWLWQPFTYLFLHGGLFHWLFNMFIFWMFGAELERRWGTFEFVKYFFITGLGAAACVLALGPHSMVPTIGASGAVYGMIVAFAVLYPESVLYMYFLIPMKVWQAAILFAFIEFFAGMQGGGSGISRFAHLGGMLTGFLYLKFWDSARIQVKGWFRTIPLPSKPRVELHEVTDELVDRVDHILDKVLKEGVDSLTPEEKKLMDRYSRNETLMPELPEVETIRRDLEAALRGDQAASFTVYDRRLMSLKEEARWKSRVVGQVWKGFHRKGKYLSIELADGSRLVFHLRMTGQLLLEPSSGLRSPSPYGESLRL